LFWDELSPALKPSVFNIRTVPERLHSQKTDPWAEFFEIKQSIRGEILEALRIPAK
jgi:bifunctional non-homologous end joining protein LigD